MRNFAEFPIGIRLSDIFRKTPSERELNWRTAKDMAQNAGIIEAMRNIAKTLEDKGDDTVELWENTAKLSSDYMLTLYFYGDNALADAYYVLPSNRGVRAITNFMGNIRVEYTDNDNWVDMQKPQGGDRERLRAYIFGAQDRARDVPVLKDPNAKGRRILLDK